MTKKEVFEIIKNEPVYKKFEYRGYIYEVVRNRTMLHYCGYVYTKFNEPNGNMIIEDRNRIYCHGGITYSDDKKIGFDTAHYTDIVPMLIDDRTSKLFDDMFGFRLEPTYKDIDFCENECRNIIDQLIEMNNSTNVIPLKR